MNKIYRLVRNRLTGLWVAVAECARAGGSRSKAVAAATAFANGVALAQAAPAPTALPTGGQVAAGQATLSQQGATLTVNQSSGRAAIDWSTFNVGSQAQVNFAQPGSGSVTLNRVNDANPSQIFGRITSNGQVFLSNPNGVYFAPGARVDVGGLVATTHRIGLDDFMAGKTTFDRNGATGSVINEGELRAALGGYIALLAPEVRNQGVIVANMGTVALAAGEAFELKFDGNNTLASLRVTPSTIRALVDNRSAVLAPGGLVILSAQAVDAVQGGVIRNSGRIEATGLQQRGGRIVLDASDRIENTGTISADASAQGPAGSVSLQAPAIVNNGTISARGDAVAPALGNGGTIALAANAFTQGSDGALDVSGAVQGGSIQVQATAQVVLAGRVDASATATAPAGSPAHAGGSVGVQAAQITTQDARIDASGDTGGSVTLDAGAPPSPGLPQPMPGPVPGSLVLNGATQVNTRGRRGQGGTATLLGDAITLAGTTAIDATGSSGGGTVQVGGGLHGAGGLHQATSVAMGADTRIDVSATQSGDGGTAVVWSDVQDIDSTTQVAGSIAARGAAGAHGGNVETSGARVDVTGLRVDASAAGGTAGTWLVDPIYNYVIDSAAAATIVGSLNAGTNVTISTESASGPGVGATGAGDLTVSSAIAKSAGADATLTLQSNNRLIVSAPISSSVGKLNLVLWSDYENTNVGGVSINSSITTNGGAVWAGGSSSAKGNYTWNGLTVGDGPSVGSGTANANGMDLAGDITTAGGNVLLWAGTGNVSGGGNPTGPGIGLGGSHTINAGSGNVTLIANSIFSWTSGTLAVNSTGTLSLAPATGGAYGAAFNWTGSTSGSNFTLGNTLSSVLTINNVASLGGLALGLYSGMSSGGTPVVMGNTANFSDSTPISVAGPITIEGGQVLINSSLTSTATGDLFIKATSTSNVSMEINADILKTGGATSTLTLQSEARVLQDSGHKIQASGTALNVVVWTDYDNANLGGASIDGTVTTNGGNVWIGGSNTTAGHNGWNGLTVGDGPSVSSSTGNANSLDLYGTINSGGGDVLVWAGGGTGGGTAGVNSNNTGSITAGAGNVTLLTSGFVGTTPISTSGVLTFAPNGGAYGGTFNLTGSMSGADFGMTASFSGMTIKNLANVSGLVIGQYAGMTNGGSTVTQGNTSDVNINSAISLAGPVTLVGGNVTLAGNVTTTTAATAPVTIKATGNITQNAGVAVTTNASNVIDWADTDGSSSGNVVLVGGTSSSYASIATSGGGVWMGGGSGSTTWTPYTGATAVTVGNGYAFSSSNTGTGVFGVDLATYARVNAGSGNVWLAGRSNETGADYGVGARMSGATITGGNVVVKGIGSANSGSSANNWGTSFEGSTLTASGQVDITGQGGSGSSTGGLGHGVYLSGSALGTTTGALNITGTGGTGTGTQNYGIVVSGNSTISATSGPVTLIGTGGGTGASSDNDGVSLGSFNAGTNVISTTTGLIAFTGTQGIGGSSEGFTFANATGTTSVGASGQSGNVTVNASSFWGNLAASGQFLGTGTLTFAPLSAAASFTAGLDTTNMGIASTLTGVTLGKSGNAANVTIGRALSVAGPISIYGGAIGDGNTGYTIASTGTAATSGILLQASAGITDGASITTAGGDITLWANAAGASAGGIQVGNNVTLSSSGGAITLGGSVGTITGLPATSANGTTLPQGYAQNFAATTSGIQLGTDAGTTGSVANVTINSGNGRIGIAGQSSQSSNSTSFGVLAYEAVNVNAGTGDIALYGSSTAIGSNNADLGFSLSPWFTSVTAASKWQTNGGHIVMTGSATGNSGTGTNIGADPTGDNTGSTVTIENTGTASGDVTITGSATGSTNNWGIRTAGANILSRSGSITLNDQAGLYNQLASYTTTLGYKAGSDVTASSANLTVNADAVSLYVLNANTSGTVALQSNAGSFSSGQTIASGTFNVAAGASGLTIGKTSNTADVTLAATESIAGPISVYGGNLNLNSSLTSTLAGAAILAKATGNITGASNLVLTTNAGALTLWSDSDASGAGYILLNDSSTLDTRRLSDRTSSFTNTATGGGAITLSGGADVTTGYAVSANTANRGGIDFGDQQADSNNNNTIYSGGGAVVMRGETTSGSSMMGINWVNGGTLNAGTGTIALTGLSASGSSGHGMELGSWHGTGTVTMVAGGGSASAPAISLTGTAGSTGGNGVQANVSSFQAIGTGGITIVGAATNAGNYGVIASGSTMDLLSASGAISVNGGNHAIEYVGTVGQKASTNVTSSTSSATFTSDIVQFTAASSVATGGTFTVQPNAASFSSALTTTNLSVGSSVSGLTLGKSGNTADITVPNAFSLAGPISVYGGNLNINAALTSTLAGAGILLKASGNIIDATGITLTTNGGAITYWADSDASGAGFILLNDNSTLDSRTNSDRSLTNTTTASGGGAITLSGGADPTTGYAVSNGTANRGGINFGDETVDHTNNNTIYSGGGAILMRGQDLGTSMGIQWTNAATVNAGSTGTIALTGLNNGGHGIELSAWHTSGAVTMVAGGGSSSTPAISITGTSGTSGNGVQSAQASLQADGAGGITIVGHAPTSSQTGVTGSFDFLSASGAISVDGGVAGMQLTSTFGAKAATAVTGSSASVTLTGDNVVFGGASSAATSGTMAIQSSAASFSTAQTTANLTLGASVTGFTEGKTTNTSDVTIPAAQTIAGPIAIYANNIALNASLTTTGAGSGILAKAVGDVNIAASTTFQTNNGNVTIWSDSDASGGGAIAMGNSVTFNSANGSTSQQSGGGKVTLAGGADTNADGLPDGVAVTTAANGIAFGTSAANSAAIYSGGGDVLVNGKSSATSGSYDGILVDGALNITSGQGAITLGGQSATYYGIAFSSLATGTSLTLNSAKTSGTAISITGSTTGTSTYGVVFDNNAVENVLATGGGAIAINGTGTSYGVWFQNTNVLASSGAITVDGGTGGINVASGATGTVFGKSTSGVTSSSSNVTLSGNVVNIAAPLTVDTTGTVTVQPSGASFTSALTWPIANFTIGSGVTGLTLGKAGNTADITIGTAQSIAGPISVYGGNVTTNAALASTAAGAGILLKGSGAVVDGGNLSTNDGDITLWANSTGLAAGGIDVKTGMALSSTGGAITLGGSVGSITGAPATSTLGTALPTGYAQNYSTTNVGLLLGTWVGAMGQNANVTMNSGNGRIALAGESTTGAFSVGLMSYQGIHVDAGTGDIALNGVSTSTTGGNMNIGFSLAPSSGSVTAFSRWQTNGGNITMTGAASGSNTVVAGANPQGSDNGSAVNILNTSTSSGGITINGSASGGSSVADTWGIGVNNTNILSASGAITLNASSGNFHTESARNFTVGYYPSDTFVPASTSNITINADSFDLQGVARVYTSGTLTVQSAAASFAGPVDIASGTLVLGATVSGLNLGKSTNTANITLDTALAVAGPVAITGGDITLDAGLTATNSTLTLTSAGTDSEGASGFVAAGNLLLAGGSATLANASNAIGTLAASGMGSLTYDDSNALTIGTVGATHGIGATSYVHVGTFTGDLTVAQNVATNNAGSSAIALNAGINAAAGTAAGGNLVISGTPTISVGTGGTALLYSGSVSDTSLATLVGSGSGRFRYDSDESATNYTLALSTGLDAIYREQPTITRSVDSQTITYADTPAYTFTLGNAVNGDSAAQAFAVAPTVTIGGLTSTSGNAIVGTHTLTASGGGANQLGYAVSGGVASGTLTVTPRTLTVTYADSGKAYDGDMTTTVTRASDDRVASDVLGVAWTGSAFASKDAANGIGVSVTGVSLSGTDSGNYTVADGSTTANITPRLLTLSGAKTYDGTTGLAGNVTLGNLVSGETLAYSGATANDAHVVTAGKFVNAITLADGTGGGLSANYALPTLDAAHAAVTISALGVSATAAIGSTLTKAYDGTLAATGASVTGTVTGALAGDTLALDATGLALAYDTAHVATASAIAATGSAGVSVSSSTHGSLASDYALTAPTIASVSATITPATLTTSLANTGVTKAYDGTQDAPSGFAPTWTVTGLASGDTAAAIANTGAAYDSKNVVGATKVTVSGMSLTGVTGTLGSQPGDYALDATSRDVAATITPKSVTLSASKTYDGTTDLTGSVTLGSLVGSETLAYTGAASSDAHVATTGKFVNAIALADGTNGGLASNYALPTLDAADAAVTIAARAITATAAIGGTLAKAYDGTLAATGASVSGTVGTAVSGDTLSLDASGVTLAYDSAHVVSAANIVASGSAGFTIASTTHASVASDYAFTAPTIAAAPATITAATLTASLANTGVTRTYDGTQAAPSGFTPAWTVTGFASGDTAATVTSTGSAYDSKNVASATKVTVSGLGVSAITGSLGSLAGDYALDASSKDVAATITAKTVTLSGSKTYDGTTDLGGHVALGSLVGSETLTYTGATSSDAHVATTGKFIDAITLADGTNGGLASNYALPTLDAANAAVTISARAIGGSAAIGGTLTKSYDGTQAATGANVTGSVSNAASGDTLSIDTSGVTLAYDSSHVVSAAHIVATGGAGFTIASTSNGSVASDYAFTAPTIASAAATITPASLTATLTNSGVTKVYDGGTSAPSGFAPTWNVTGLATGDTAVALTNTGSAFNDQNVVGASHVTVGGLATGAIAGSLGSAASDYALSSSTASVAATITPKTVTLSGSKTYDGAVDLSGSVSLGSLVGSETLTYTGATSSDAHVATAGKYVSTITLADGTNGGIASNYALPTLDAANAAVSIAARAITGSASIGGTLTKSYDGTQAATGANATGSVSNAASGDTLSLDTAGVTLAYDSAHVVSAAHIVATGGAGFTIASTSNGSVASDYAFTAPTIASAAATIAPASITATLTNTGVTKVYDGGTSAPSGFAPTWNVTGLATGDTAIALTNTGSAFNSQNVVGASHVTVGGLAAGAITGTLGSAASDYALSSTTASVSATITPKMVTLSGSKTYDGSTSLAGDVTLGSLVGSETLAYTGATSSDAHVATAGKYVNAITLADGTNGGLASNYALPTLDAANAAVTVSARAITGSASIGGTLTKAYDGTQAATGASVTGSVSNAASGDTLSIDTSGVTLAYDSAHVVSAAHIVATGGAGFTIAATSNGSVASDYAFTAPTIASAAATISPTSLTATLTNGGVTKVYDGGTSAPTGFTPTWNVTGLATGDTAIALTNTGSSFNSQNVVGASHVTVGGLATGAITGTLGSAASDYALSSTTASVPATITPKTVTLSGSKTYDGSTSLAGDVTLGSLVGSETLAYTGATASDAHVATTGKFVDAITLADGANGGLASNYALPSLDAANAAVTIAARAITGSASIGGTLTKAYDGTQAATGASITGSVSNAASGDTLSIDTTGVTLAYDSAHVVSAAHIVATGGAGFTIGSTSNGSVASDYTFTAPTIASAVATITPASITATLTNSGVTKVYDGGTSAPSGFAPTWNVTGLATGDTAIALTNTGSAFNSQNVVGASHVSVGGLATGAITGSLGSAASDYALSSSTASVAATITPKTVTLSGSKTYDGSTSLAGDVTLGSLVGSETLAYTGATSSDAHVVTTGKFVDAITLADGTNGGLASNYALPALDAAHAAVTIATRAISGNATIGGTLSKTYDGTNDAAGATVSGSVGNAAPGDTLSLDTSGVVLAYDSTHASANRNIVSSGNESFAIASSTHGSLLSDYSFTPSTIGAVTAAITPATLTAALANTGVTKTYDGTLAAPAGFVPTWTLTGLVAGDASAAIANTGAAYDSKDVAGASQVTVGGLGLGAITGSRASRTSDYTLTTSTASVAATITPRTLTLSGAKTYDGTTNLAGDVVLGGLVGGETLVYAGATSSDAHVATSGKFVDAITLADGGNGGLAANYVLPALNANNAPVVIAPLALTAEAAITGATTKTYDGTVAATGAAITGNVLGGVNGDVLALATNGVTLAYDSAHVDTATGISATGNLGLAISTSNHGSQASDYSFTAPTLAPVAATVTPATLGATLANSGVTKVYDGGTGAPSGFVPAWNVTGLVAGDTAAAIASTGAAYDSKDVTSATHVGVGGMSLSAVSGGNASLASDYVLASTLQTVAATITPRSVSVSGLAVADKTYDGTTGATVTDWGHVTTGVGSETLQLSAAGVAFGDANAGSGKTVTASGYGLSNGSNGGVASNYALANTTTSTTADIAKATLDVVANNDAKFVTQADASGYGGVSYSGFVHGETLATSGVVGSASVSRSNAGAQAAGSYAGVLVPDASGLLSTNYSVVAHAGDYTIVPADQLLVRVTPVTAVYGSAPTYTLASAQYLDSATNAVVTLSGVTALGNGRFSVADGAGGSAAFTLAAGQAGTSSTGWTNVGAWQLGASNVTTANAQNFNGTLTVVGSETVTPRQLSASASSGISKVYDGSTSMVGVTLQLAGTVSGDHVDVDGSGTFQTKNAGTNIGYTLSGISLAGADAGNYYLAGNGSFAGSNGTITPRTLTVSYSGVDKVYDGGTAATFTTGDNRIAGDVLNVYGIGAFADKNVGAGKTVQIGGVTLTGTDAGNYVVAATGSTSAGITRLSSVTWVGGATGNWFDPANWAGGAVPDLANVANVVIPAGVVVAFDTTGMVAPAQAGAVRLDGLGAAGSLTQADGQLVIGNGGVTLHAIDQQGGSLSSAGSIAVDSFTQTHGSTSTEGNLTVNGHFSQGPEGSVSVAGDATLHGSSGGMTLGNLSVGGGLAVDNTTGDVTQASGTTIAVQGTTTVDAGTHDVSLNGANNDFGGTVNATGHDVILVDGHGGLALGNVTANGSLNATSTDGNLTQAAGTTIAVQGTTTVDAGTHDVSLNGANNDFGGTVNATGHDVTLVDGHGGLTLGNVTASGSLNATSSDGNLTQAAGTTIAVQGSTTVDAGTHDVSLNGANNDFGGTVNATGHDVTLVDGHGGLTLGNVTASGSLNATSTDGNLTQAAGATIAVQGSTTVDAGTHDVSLNGANNDFGGTVNATGHDVTLVDGHGGLTLGNVTASGSLNATSTDGNLTQAAGTTIAVQGTTTVDAGTHDVSLNGANNDFGGTVNATGHDVTLVDGHGGLTLGNVTASGSLNATSTDGNLTQAAGATIAVQGSTTVDAGTHDVSLNGANNDFGGTVNATGHDVTLVDGHGGLTLGNVTASGALNATSTGGDIGQAGGTTISVAGSGTLQAPGAHVTIGLAGNTFGGSMDVVDAGGSHAIGSGSGDNNTGSNPIPPAATLPPLPVSVPPTLPLPETAPPALEANALTPVSAPVSSVGTASPPAANDASGAVDPGVRVRLVDAPTEQATGLVTVEVPRESATNGFRFALPSGLADQAPADAVITATRESGRPLPAWLRFDRQHLQFVATAVPARGLPLKVVLTIGGRSTTIVITRETVRQSRAATGTKRTRAAV